MVLAHAEQTKALLSILNLHEEADEEENRLQ
jgi:hypothetical protein